MTRRVKTHDGHNLYKMKLEVMQLFYALMK